ncbi:uncharacterized protein LOC133663394 isoform X2 [Entelurus aequoreus]|uniref:uncharacterized protein LOC133663394 isoform X2 n=1 Tax=Entelurus aequoreus TaxID=161455 RepID=UPI002B1E2460|nr:uncharacterized protein LOC133663394 isoform X2 [Entelurus aequoreus]
MYNSNIFLMTLGFTRLVTGGALIRSVWIVPKNWPIIILKTETVWPWKSGTTSPVSVMTKSDATLTGTADEEVMEEIVRTLLQTQDTLQFPKIDQLDLMKAYKDNLLEEMWKQQDSLAGPKAPEEEMSTSMEASGGLEENKNSNSLIEQLRALEAENSALSLENDNQRKQYERCLDEVANQVVQALLTQKDLKEECVKLRTRVFDLEQQNHRLRVLFQQQMRTSQNLIPKEVERNGKASIAAGRWPSLLSLICPRNIESGGEMLLSRTCSEYSSGSHTWTEGQRFSKQQKAFGWKEEHTLKSLQRSSPKDKSYPASVPHCNDFMASNDDIYSLDVKTDPLKTTSDQTKKNVKGGIAAIDSDGSRNDFHTSQNNLTFLGGPAMPISESPTASLTQSEENNEGSQEEYKNSGIILSNSNNNQERSTDRKSRLDHMKRQKGRPAVDGETRTSDSNIVIPHSATRALICVSEARQHSSSVEIFQCRNQSNQDHGILKSPQRIQKPKPLLNDSARKALIIRSKSADGAAERHKRVHSPLHQNLIRAHKSKGHSNAPGHSASNKMSNYAKLHGSSPEVENDGNIAQSSCKSLERIQQPSPLASPVKHYLASKPLVGDDCSKNLSIELQLARAPSSSDCVQKRTYDNLPCAPKQPQKLLSDVLSSEHLSKLPPTPPGRTTSLLRRTASHSVCTNPSAVQSQNEKTIYSNTAQNNQYLPTQLDFEICYAKKEAPAHVFKTHSSRMSVIPVQDALESATLSDERTVICRSGDISATILPGQNILHRFQESISEPKLSEVMPQTLPNTYYPSVTNNCQSSTSSFVEIPLNVKFHDSIDKDDINPSIKGIQTFQTYIRDPMTNEYGAHNKAQSKIETRCNSLNSEPCGPHITSDSGVMLDWGFDEEGWLFKRSVSVSDRPPLKPVLGMNGAKVRSKSFGARYMDRLSFNRSGKLRTQIKTHSGSSLNSFVDVLPESMNCSSSYNFPMNQSLLNHFLIEEGLAVPSHVGLSSERLHSLKHQREQARRLQIEQQFSNAFGELVCEEPERQSTITTIEEKVMLGIEENLQKSQEQERSSEMKQSSPSTLASWFGFRKGKFPVPSSKKTDAPKLKEDRKDQRITSLLGGKQTKIDKKKDRKKSDRKDCSVGRRKSHDAVRACISLPCPGVPLNETPGQNDLIIGDAQLTACKEGTTKNRFLKRKACLLKVK